MALTQHISKVDKSQSPYQIDPDQALRASQALLRHVQTEIKRLQNESSKKNLLAANDSDDEEDGGDTTPIWLNLTTKQSIVDKNRLKPSKIKVPHSLNTSQDATICLITTDPQRAVKNVVADPSFPTELSTRITRIIGISKLAARYKSFEQRRQLVADHDIFLADERIVARLPKLLGKVFYKGTSKRPIPVNMAPKKEVTDKAQKVLNKKVKKEDKQAEVGTPTFVASEIEKAIACVPVSIQPGHNIPVRVATTSFTAQQLMENVVAVAGSVIDKHVVQGWRNVRSIHIKSPTSMAVPIWLADDLWTNDDQVAQEGKDEIEGVAADAQEQKKRKRNPASSKGPQAGDRKKARLTESKEAEKSASKLRKKKLADQKAALVSAEA